MAHTGIFTKPKEWWKHLRKFNKQRFHKGERKAAKIEVLKDAMLASEETLASFGLYKSAVEMRKLKAEKGKEVIPEGIYCDGCPYHDYSKTHEHQDNGFCWFEEIGDWQINQLSLLWDGCKECGIKDEVEYDEEIDLGEYYGDPTENW